MVLALQSRLESRGEENGEDITASKTRLLALSHAHLAKAWRGWMLESHVRCCFGHRSYAYVYRISSGGQRAEGMMKRLVSIPANNALRLPYSTVSHCSKPYLFQSMFPCSLLDSQCLYSEGSIYPALEL
jgi:hypothetical protein